MNHDAPRFERFTFTSLVALLLGPVVAQASWRSLGHVLGVTGDARALTGAALAIALAGTLPRAVRPGLVAPLAVGVIVALGAAGALSLGVAGMLALVGVAVTTALLAHGLPAQLPVALEGLARRRPRFTALYGLLALASLASVARVSVFMGDATHVEMQVLPGERFLQTHSCLSAYVRADVLVRRRVDNLYDTRWWEGPDGQPLHPVEPDDPYRPFVLDYYAYPPPFLLLVTPLTPFHGDFAAQRALWFGLNALLLAVGLAWVARRVEGPGAHRVVLLAPIFFACLPVLATLQVGNFQIAVVMISILAMVAFARGRDAAGGALLALAILSKISPGLLAVLLLAQRRWRALAWTALFGVLLLALSAALFGVGPLRSFVVYLLPRLSSGEAFAFLDDAPFSIATNMSPFGLPFKLRMMGLHVGDPWNVARHLGRAYTLALVVVIALAARRPRGDLRHQAVVWMSLLILGALQSPFAPGYTFIALLWATTLLAADVRTVAQGASLALLWVGLTVAPPWHAEALVAAQSVLQSMLALAVPTWLILRRLPTDHASPRA